MNPAASVNLPAHSGPPLVAPGLSNPDSSLARGRWLLAVILLLQCALPLWLSLNDHPLYAPDEGRYGSVSAQMLESHQWLVPMRNGQPHLTKPPLVYWLQATAMEFVSDDVLALRLPSALAATLAVLITFGLGSHWAGPRRGVIASGLLSLTPLHIAVGRLAITDSILTLCWLGALAAGARAVTRTSAESSRSYRWTLVMWVAVAAGLLTKGPLGLAPVGLLLIWLSLTGQSGSIRRLHLPIGLPLALTPLLVWVGLIVQRDPEAVSIWQHEIFSRAAGSGDHPEPIWYYLPVVIAGLFPATATLSLPGIEYSWREAWRYCRNPHLGSLFVVATLVPLAGFSLMAGKLATYMLPIAPPLALLGAAVLESRLFGSAGARGEDRSIKRTVATVFIVSMIMLGLVVGFEWRVEPSSLWTAVLVAALPLTALLIWWQWRRIRDSMHGRVLGLAILWIAAITSWFGALEFEDAIGRTFGTDHLMHIVHNEVGPADPLLVTLGYEDPTLFHYLRGPAPAIAGGELAHWAQSVEPADRRRAILLARENIWLQYAQKHPDIASLFEVTGSGTYRLNTAVLILRFRDR